MCNQHFTVFFEEEDKTIAFKTWSETNFFALLWKRNLFRAFFWQFIENKVKYNLQFDIRRICLRPLNWRTNWVERPVNQCLTFARAFFEKLCDDKFFRWKSLFGPYWGIFLFTEPACGSVHKLAKKHRTNLTTNLNDLCFSNMHPTLVQFQVCTLCSEVERNQPQLGTVFSNCVKRTKAH